MGTFYAVQINEQVAKQGYRLAAWLNEIFDGSPTAFAGGLDTGVLVEQIAFLKSLSLASFMFCFGYLNGVRLRSGTKQYQKPSDRIHGKNESICMRR